MKSFNKIMITILLLLSVIIANAQMKNPKTDPSVSELAKQTVKIFGNCGMCKSRIEKAGNIKDVATVQWNKVTKVATLTYDADKTNPDEILKQIALAGHDNQKFPASDMVYEDLPGCCQYDREAKSEINKDSDSRIQQQNINNQQ